VIRVLQLSNVLRSTDFLPASFRDLPEAVNYPPLGLAWIRAWRSNTTHPFYKEYRDKATDDILKELMWKRNPDRRLRMLIRGKVDGKEAWMYRYGAEIGRKVEELEGFVGVHKSMINIGRSELGCGIKWWCDLGGVKTEFDKMMKYLLDRELLVVRL